MGQQAAQRVREALMHQTFLTCGGVETHLLFTKGYPLRDFCAFEVLEDEGTWDALVAEFFSPMASAAAAHGLGFMTDCLTWRASPDYVRKLGYADASLAEINRRAVTAVRRFIDGWRPGEGEAHPVLLSAELGPRGDGYALSPEETISVEAARDYHTPQLTALAECDVDVVMALTLTSATEAVGIAKAAEELGLALLLSPTVETNGMLPSGTSIGDFIERVDEATEGNPVGYMVNCAHPTHLAAELAQAATADAPWLERLIGVRANASRKSHEELDKSTELDRGNPPQLGHLVADLRREYGLRIVGGCCGTDVEHTRAIASACAGHYA